MDFAPVSPKVRSVAAVTCNYLAFSNYFILPYLAYKIDFYQFLEKNQGKKKIWIFLSMTSTL